MAASWRSGEVAANCISSSMLVLIFKSGDHQNLLPLWNRFSSVVRVVHSCHCQGLPKWRHSTKSGLVLLKVHPAPPSHLPLETVSSVSSNDYNTRIQAGHCSAVGTTRPPPLLKRKLQICICGPGLYSPTPAARVGNQRGSAAGCSFRKPSGSRGAAKEGLTVPLPRCQTQAPKVLLSDPMS